MSTVQFQQIVVPPGVIDLGIGQPQNDILPLGYVRDAAVRHLDRLDILQYGAEWGDGHYRIALADYLTAAYGCAVDAEMLFTTNGNSQALEMVSTVFAEPGDIVFVEEPTFFLAPRIFHDHHLQLRTVATDEHGLVVSDLAEQVSIAAAEGHRVAFVYTIPAFHNPTGCTLPLERRQELVALSQERGFLVVADEVYHLLSYGETRPPLPLSAFVDAGTVLSLGTFSKILAPGMRLGWVHGAHALLQRMAGCGLILSGGGLNPLPGLIATSLMREGWQSEYLNFLRNTYAHRVQLMAAALRESAPAWLQFEEPQGGYFFWIGLPVGLDAADVRSAAAAAKVDFRHGALFSQHGGLGNRLRLSFTFYGDHDLREGVRRLGSVLAGF